MSIPLDRLQTLLEQNRTLAEKFGDDYFKAISNSQTPWITLLSCCDSRVQPHELLEDPTNQIFAVNVLGNAFGTTEGAVDYGIYHLNTPILLIVGHSDCGAVKAFEEEPSTIQTALEHVATSFQDGLEAEVCQNVEKNMHHQVALALDKYKDLVEKGRLTVVGAYFDLANDLGHGYGELIIKNINGDRNYDMV